jgi:hypothetical protein
MGQRQYFLLISSILTLIGILVFLIFNIDRIREAPIKKAAPVILPTPTGYLGVNATVANDCGISIDGNSLVATISGLIEQGNRYTSIFYKGSVKNVEAVKVVDDEVLGVKLTLESSDKKQSHPYQLLQEEELVFDLKTRSYKKVSDLKVGQDITMQAKCLEGTKNFKITSVVIR